MPDGLAGSLVARRASQSFPPCSGASGQTAVAAGPAALLRIQRLRPGVRRWPLNRGSGAPSTAGAAPGEMVVVREVIAHDNPAKSVSQQLDGGGC